MSRTGRPPQCAFAGLVLSHPTLLYLGSISLITALALLAALRLPGVGTSALWTMAALGLLFPPALDVAIALVQRLVAWRVAPHRLPRLDFTDGIPDDARTMVIIPTLLGSADAVKSLLAHLEVLAHGNLDPRHPLRHPRRFHGRTLGDARTTTRRSWPRRPKACSI